MNGRYCDIAIQAPSGLDMAGHQALFPLRYVFVTRKDCGSDIKSLADPRLKKLKIGVNMLNSDAENTPPTMALSQYGVVGNLIGFTLSSPTRNGPRTSSLPLPRRMWTWRSSGDLWPDTSSSSPPFHSC